MEFLKLIDSQVYDAISLELARQQHNIELIASENFVSRAVLAAAGSVLTNKYAEGYPGKRYYGGCEFVDMVENLAISRAKLLFNVEHANVQPHSGSQANMAVYFAFLDPGDTILGMSLTHGGHLTHGHPINISGKYYNVIPYGVSRETGRIDYDEVRRLARRHNPKIIVAGASAYPRLIDFALFAEIAREIDAYLMADIAHIAGLVATGLHPSPGPNADFITTTTHKTLRGPRGGMILCQEEYAAEIDRAVFPGIQGGPLMHIIAAKAVALGEALSEDFASYQQQVVANAQALAQGLLEKDFKLVSGGTDNHLLLVDLRSKGMTGKEAEEALGAVGITVNKNAIPFDSASPFITSGIRLGTPAMTSRGMREAEMEEIADLIYLALTHRDDGRMRAQVNRRVQKLCAGFPLYTGLFTTPTQ